MVTIEIDSNVSRAKEYKNIESIIRQLGGSVSPAGTGRQIQSNNGYKFGLFLYWDNRKIYLRGAHERLLPLAECLESHGYVVTIETDDLEYSAPMDD